MTNRPVSVNMSAKAASPPTVAVTKGPLPFVPFVVKSLDKFGGKAKDEISFKKGELILVYEENAGEGRYKGEVMKADKQTGAKTGKIGWFPSFYVKRENESQATSKNSNLPPPSISSQTAVGKAVKGDSKSRSAPATPPRKLYRTDTIRTLKLENNADDDDDDDDEDDDKDDNSEQETTNTGDKNSSAYMAGVASKMKSKLSFLQRSSAKKGADKGAFSLFPSLRKKDDQGFGTSGHLRSASTGVSSPYQSKSGKLANEKADKPSITTIAKRLEEAQLTEKDEKKKEAAKHHAIVEEVATGKKAYASSPDLKELKESAKKTVEFTPDSKLTTSSDKPERRHRSASSSKAVIVEDAPQAKTADVHEFSPEGKTIEILELLGKGAAGSVWRGCIDGEYVAVKQISLEGVRNPRALRTALKDEVALMKPFNHPNVLKYYGLFYSKKTQEINIVLELVDGLAVSSLVAKQVKLKETIAAQIVMQVLESLAFLAGQGIIHRDVKPQNMLVNYEGFVKMIDFGTCARITGGQTCRNSTVGTPWYVAPEVINGDDYSYESDIWSVGCTLLELATGKPPYHDQNSVAALFKMVEDTHPPIAPELSDSCKQFLDKCFVRDWKQRQPARTLMEDPWVTAADSVQELSKQVRVTSMLLSMETPTDSPATEEFEAAT